MSAEELPVVFKCDGDRLVGILHRGQAESSVGIVIVVGGPQYRVGSHRQFVLMARMLAESGFPVLRFDYRGMGDSDGEVRSFEGHDDDIRAAVDKLVGEIPTLDNVVLLGLCDAASASLMYCLKDDRLAGLVLLNPWVRTEQGEAKAYLKHYYWKRLIQKSFWAKVVSGRISILSSLSEFGKSLRTAYSNAGEFSDGQRGTVTDQMYINRMLKGLANSTIPILFLISGRDLTASEFLDLCKRNADWNRACIGPNVTTVSIKRADHTMSDDADLRMATQACITWLEKEVTSRAYA